MISGKSMVRWETFERCTDLKLSANAFIVSKTA